MFIRGLDPEQFSIGDLEKKNQELWNENGNELSLQYAGSYSTTQGVTVKKKADYFDYFNQKLASCTRFYNANVSDTDKNNALQIMLNRQDKGKEIDEEEVKENPLEEEIEIENQTQQVKFHEIIRRQFSRRVEVTFGVISVLLTDQIAGVL